MKSLVKKVVKPLLKFLPLPIIMLNVCQKFPFLAQFSWKILHFFEVEAKLGQKYSYSPSLYHYWRKRYKTEARDTLAKNFSLLDEEIGNIHFVYVIDPKANFIATCLTIISLKRQSYKNIDITIHNNEVMPLKARLYKMLAGYMANFIEDDAVYVNKPYWVLDILPGDRLDKNALLEISLYITKTNTDWQIIYFDEDVAGAFGIYRWPFFKPDYSAIYNEGIDYISGACVYSSKYFPDIHQSETHEAIFMQVLNQICNSKVLHIPEVLVHKCRKRPFIYNEKNKNIQLPLEECNDALTSIIIPSKDNVAFLKNCINSILEKTESKKIQIIIIDNNSNKQETFDYYTAISKDNRFKIIYYPYEFNYSAMNNIAAHKADGRYLVFLNNDTEVISSDWLIYMKYWLSKPSTGCVGAKLLYADHTIQHVGVVIGASMGACHYNVGDDEHDCGYYGINTIPREVSAVSAACMGVRKDNFFKIGGFDEKIKVAFNDIDLCLRMKEHNFINIIDPRIQLFHFESKTRGYDNSDGIIRDREERNLFVMNSKTDIRFDEYYNPNLSLNNTYSLSFPPRTISMVRLDKITRKKTAVLIGSTKQYGDSLAMIMKAHRDILERLGYSIIYGIDSKKVSTTIKNLPCFFVRNEWDAADMIIRKGAAYVIVYSEPYQKIAWMMPKAIKIFYLHCGIGWTTYSNSAIKKDLRILDRQAAEKYALRISSIEEFIEHTNG